MATSEVIREHSDDGLGRKTVITRRPLPGEIRRRVVFAGEHPLRAWRESRRLSLRKMAQDLDISAGHLSDIENFKRNLTDDLRARIAEKLDLDPAYLEPGAARELLRS